MNDHLAQIQNSSISVREKLELFQKKHRAWNKDLKGACATASYLLQQELAKFNINSWMVKANSKDVAFGEHVWLETDHFAIDLTHSQFNKKEPMIITCKSNDQYDDFIGNFHSPETVGIDFFDHWPTNQRPKNCILKMNNKKKKAISV